MRVFESWLPPRRVRARPCLFILRAAAFVAVEQRPSAMPAQHHAAVRCHRYICAARKYTTETFSREQEIIP